MENEEFNLPEITTTEIQTRNPSGPKIKVTLSDEQLKLLETLSINPTSTWSGMARLIKIRAKHPERALQNAIKKYYKSDPNEWLNQQHNQGIQYFGQKFFEACCDKKSNPILKIFAAKNWLGMKDERTVKSPDDNSDKSMKALELMTNIIQKISDKSNTVQITQDNNNIQNAEYTIIKNDTSTEGNSMSLNDNDLQQINNNSNIEDRKLNSSSEIIE